MTRRIMRTDAPVYDGRRLFELKATHGLPLEVAVDRIINVAGFRISWPGFVVQAREQGWWDFQTVEAVEQALTDADVDRSYRDEIMHRLELYIQCNPLNR